MFSFSLGPKQLKQFYLKIHFKVYENKKRHHFLLLEVVQNEENMSEGTKKPKEIINRQHELPYCQKH